MSTRATSPAAERVRSCSPFPRLREELLCRDRCVLRVAGRSRRPQNPPLVGGLTRKNTHAHTESPARSRRAKTQEWATRLPAPRRDAALSLRPKVAYWRSVPVRSVRCSRVQRAPGDLLADFRCSQNTRKIFLCTKGSLLGGTVRISTRMAPITAPLEAGGAAAAGVTTPRNRQRFLQDLHPIDRDEILRAMRCQDQLSSHPAGTPGDPRTSKKRRPSTHVAGKQVSICRPHMRAGVQGRADARTRSFEPGTSQGVRGTSGKGQTEFSLHLEFALQSARCVNAKGPSLHDCMRARGLTPPVSGAKSPSRNSVHVNTKCHSKSTESSQKRMCERHIFPRPRMPG